MDQPDQREQAFALGDLYDQLMPKVYRYFLSRTRDPQSAQDLTSQTFLAVLEHWPRYREEGRAEAWIFRIARHKAVDFFRRNPEQPLCADWPDPQPDVPHRVHETDQKQRLSQVISRLEPEEKDLLRLRYSAGLSFVEMAHILGKKEDAVKKAVYRLLERLEAEVGHD